MNQQHISTLEVFMSDVMSADFGDPSSHLQFLTAQVDDQCRTWASGESQGVFLSPRRPKDDEEDDNGEDEYEDDDYDEDEDEDDWDEEDEYEDDDYDEEEDDWEEDDEYEDDDYEEEDD